MMTGEAKDPKKEAERAVKAVSAFIVKTVKEAFGMEPSQKLIDEMPGRYTPGFVAAHEDDIDFWDKHGPKVLQMAQYVGALACFLVTRKLVFLDAAKRDAYEVGVDEWLMAMGIVRTACLVKDDRARGLPCNRNNFPIAAETKAEIALVFAEIVTALMTDDPARR
jgi:hypothetical protein